MKGKDGFGCKKVKLAVREFHADQEIKVSLLKLMTKHGFMAC